MADQDLFTYLGFEVVKSLAKPRLISENRSQKQLCYCG